MQPIVEFRNITMDFPGVRANEDVTLSINQGEIFALVGENGAGKSTLMNILYGILTPTKGQVVIKGNPITEYNPKNAISLGVGMVHQHFMLVPSFTVAQNIVLSREPKKLGLLYDLEAANKAVEDLSKDYGLQVSPTDVVRELSVGLQQRVEILKTLYRGAEILILDEPTAVLTPQETDELFAVLRRVVKEKNMTVIIITHKLYEVMAISDRVGVMRQGRLIGIQETKNVNERILASMMVGREVLQESVEKQDISGQVKIAVSGLQVPDNRGLPAVKGLSLEVKAGEILGIAAIEGNGQSELLEAITGMRPYAGQITIAGQDIRGLSPGQIRQLGLSHVPEDRLATGISRESDISGNLLVGKHKDKQFTRFGFHQNKKAIREYASRVFEKFDIRAAGVDTKAGSLSGGNMQKVVIAREFSFDSEVYIIAQPTRGVDIGAIEFIHNRILEKKAEGAAILLCSADLDEVLRLSDRVITIYEGKITGEFDRDHLEKTEIGYYMTGSREEVSQ
ncbi:MAG: ABC transporter ATP-binding protein [Oscillospiraceae bacterium]|nr:ABC transporter ATP-binding protein [Oscillospiraceae bacterium]